MDIVSIFSFVSMVSIVINVDIVIVVSTLCIVNNIRSAQYCKSHVPRLNLGSLLKQITIV